MTTKKGLLWVLVIAFVGSILWSMWTDTIKPLMASGDHAALLRHSIGLPAILFGLYALVRGGWLIIKASLGILSNNDLMILSKTVNTSSDRKIKYQGRYYFFRLFMRKWSKGAAWMLLAFGLFALGGYLINL